MCLNILAGNIGDKLLIPISFGIQYQAFFLFCSSMPNFFAPRKIPNSKGILNRGSFELLSSVLDIS